MTNRIITVLKIMLFKLSHLANASHSQLIDSTLHQLRKRKCHQRDKKWRVCVMEFSRMIASESSANA